MTIEEQGIFLFHNKTEFSKQDYYELNTKNKPDTSAEYVRHLI